MPSQLPSYMDYSILYVKTDLDTVW